MWAGIDYGSKMAGTTVICFGNNQQQLDVVGTTKKQDADEFILSVLGGVQPEFTTIDAPLSLPLIYQQPDKGSDFFYRAVDKELKAMSPLFLGGLTARAMKLKYEASKIRIPLFETYPAALVRHFGLAEHYNKKNPLLKEPFVEALLQKFPANITLQQLPTWHHVDALLAWISCYRMAHDEHTTFGDDEGQIFI